MGPKLGKLGLEFSLRLTNDVNFVGQVIYFSMLLLLPIYSVCVLGGGYLFD